MKQTAIAELTAGPRRIDETRLQRALTTAMRNAVEERLAYHSELIGIEVVAAHLLEEGQTFQIVPAAEDTEPAAAGEDIEGWAYLEGEQLRWAAYVVGQHFRTTVTDPQWFSLRLGPVSVLEGVGRVWGEMRMIIHHLNAEEIRIIQEGD